MKTAIVTGAGGFIGKSLVQKLLQSGIKVYGIDISMEAMKDLLAYENFQGVISDFEHYHELVNSIKEKNIDVFYHLAWMFSGATRKDFDIQLQNVVGTYKATHAAGELGCKKFVFACSSHEYQKNNYENNQENRVGPCSIYGASKTAAKTYAKVVAHSYDMDFNGVIFTNVFGIGDYSNRTANFFIRKLMNGEDLDLIQGNELYDWTYIDDVTGGMVAVGNAGIPGKEYYVGNPMLRPFKDILKEVRDILSPQSKLNFGAYVDTSYIDYSAINIYELYEDTGYMATCDFKESVLKTAEWLKHEVTT